MWLRRSVLCWSSQFLNSHQLHSKLQRSKKVMKNRSQRNLLLRSFMDFQVNSATTVKCSFCVTSLYARIWNHWRCAEQAASKALFFARVALYEISKLARSQWKDEVPIQKHEGNQQAWSLEQTLQQLQRVKVEWCLVPDSYPREPLYHTHRGDESIHSDRHDPDNSWIKLILPEERAKPQTDFQRIARPSLKHDYWNHWCQSAGSELGSLG